MKPNKLNVPLITAIVSLLISVNAFAQDLLVDRNGDGVIRVTAFGDSITYGVGDGTSPGAFVEVAPFTDGNIGYPPRVQALGGIEIFNQGDPGESLAVGGILRFPAVLQSTSPDVVVIFEGSNDVLQDTAPEFGRNLQKAINVANALGITPVVSTLPPECCDRGGRTPLVRQFNQRIRAVVAENELSLIDLERAWDSTCSGPECQLYNVPEGLHPNSLGYDAIAQMVLATLFGIDLFVPDGAQQFAEAFGIDPSQVAVTPDVHLEPVESESGATEESI